MEHARNIVGNVKLATTRSAATLCRLWRNYFPQGFFGEGGIDLESKLRSITYGLMALLVINASIHKGFPLITHPWAMQILTLSLFVLGFATIATYLIPFLSRGSTFAPIIARWVMVVSLFLMVGSMAYMLVSLYVFGSV